MKGPMHSLQHINMHKEPIYTYKLKNKNLSVNTASFYFVFTLLKFEALRRFIYLYEIKIFQTDKLVVMFFSMYVCARTRVVICILKSQLKFHALFLCNQNLLSCFNMLQCKNRKLLKIHYLENQ